MIFSGPRRYCTGSTDHVPWRQWDDLAERGGVRWQWKVTSPRAGTRAGGSTPANHSEGRRASTCLGGRPCPRARTSTTNTTANHKQRQLEYVSMLFFWYFHVSFNLLKCLLLFCLLLFGKCGPCQCLVCKWALFCKRYLGSKTKLWHFFWKTT